MQVRGGQTTWNECYLRRDLIEGEEIFWIDGKQISIKTLIRREVDQSGGVLVAHVLDG